MLQTFISYNDLCLEIDILKDQIKFAEYQLQYWSGIQMHDEELNGIPLGSIGANKFGVIAAIEQSERAIETINHLRERLELLEKERIKYQGLLSQFEGLDYQVAYKKYVEGKTLKDIAKELKYNYDYIREIASRLKKQA